MVCLVTSTLLSATAAGNPARQNWEPRHSIEMTYFASALGGYGKGNILGAAPSDSPDGKYSFVITRRGDLTRDCNVYKMAVYDLRSVRSAVREASASGVTPLRTFETCSQEVLEPGISRASWTPDSTAILFLHSEDGQYRQVKLWEIGSDKVTELTPREHTVESFEYQAGALSFRTAHAPDPERRWSQYPASFVREAEWKQALGIQQYDYRHFVRARTGVVREIGSAEAGYNARRQSFLSPDGNLLIVSKQVDADAIPDEWQSYRSPQAGATPAFFQYWFIDLRTGAEWAALDAPLGDLGRYPTGPQVLWAPESDRAILINVLLPLSANRREATTTSYIAEYDVRRRTSHVIAAMPAPAPEAGNAAAPYVIANWSEPGREFTLSFAGQTKSYHRESRQWRERSGTTPARIIKQKQPESILRIRQGLNEPPHLVASAGTRELQLSPDDTVLDAVALSQAAAIEWSTTDSGQWRGIFTPPMNSTAEARYPLVIQIDNTIEIDHFFPDGALTAGFAAQALAARGFAVLTMAATGPGHSGTGPQEGPRLMSGLHAVITILAKDKGIDQSRIGLLGYSRSGYLVNYAITHSREVQFAAAIIQDSFDAGYVQYLFTGSIQSSAARWQYENQYDRGGSFWANKSTWITEAPAFNADKIRTPLLLVRHGAFGGGMLGILETYAGMRMNNQPVDVRVFPEATHPLLRPRHRFAALQGTVDWMSFWIHNEEDPQPAKADQYVYWRALRAGRSAVPSP